MTLEQAWAEAYLVQARSDFAAYGRLADEPGFPFCHSLHHLQMATEKLGKAIGLKSGWPLERVRTTHAAFVPALRLLWSGPLPAHLEMERKALWRRIQGLLPLAHEVQSLAPDLAGAGPNAEYPWGTNASDVRAPASYEFPLWHMLKQPMGVRLVTLTHVVLRDFEQIFGAPPSSRPES